MTVAEFERGGHDGLQGALLALWWDAQGNWEQAHQVAQDVPGPDGAWVHAYLHRREGDLANASYWYRQAGREVARGDLRTEWEAIVADLLGSSAD